MTSEVLGPLDFRDLLEFYKFQMLTYIKVLSLNALSNDFPQLELLFSKSLSASYFLKNLALYLIFYKARGISFEI